jgi:uncharacterized protein (TIGR02246 family)
VSPDDVSPRVGEFVAAWNAHDMKRFASLFSEDADFVNVAGMWWHGRDEIERNHAVVHASRFRESVLDASLAAFKEVSPNVGVAHVTWRLDVGGVVRRGVFTWTLQERDGAVEIVAAHNTDTVGP